MDEIRSNVELIYFLHGIGCIIPIMTMLSIPEGHPGLIFLNALVLAFNAGAIIYWAIWYYRIRKEYGL